MSKTERPGKGREETPRGRGREESPRGRGRTRPQPPVPPRNPAPPKTEETVVNPPKVSPTPPPPPPKPKSNPKPPIGETSPKPSGKGQGETGVSKNAPTKPTVSTRGSDELPKDDFVEDVKVNEIIPPTPTKGDDEIVDDISQVTKDILKGSLKEDDKPFTPEKPKSDEDEIEDIIKTIEKEVDTPTNIDGSGKVDDSDTKSEDELIDKITKQEEEVVEEVPVDVVKASELEDEEERIRLEQEEQKRRELEEQRIEARIEAVRDEQERRTLFDNDIAQRRKEFRLLMDEKYPEFSKSNTQGSKKPSESELRLKEEQRIKDRAEIAKEKQKIKKDKKRLQKRKVERLKVERSRKSEEQKFRVNRMRKSEVQTFFEGDILLEQKEKTERNPEVRGETEVQIKRREIARFEKQLGRKIVPHRDIVESEESDFDRSSNTNSDDILIKVPMDNKPLKDYKKLNRLVNIRKRLDKGKGKEEDFIKKRKPSPESNEPLFRRKRRN